MINILSTSGELIEQRQALVEAFIQAGKRDRESVDAFTLQLNAIDRVLKIVLDTEMKVQ